MLRASVGMNRFAGAALGVVMFFAALMFSNSVLCSEIPVRPAANPRFIEWLDQMNAAPKAPGGAECSVGFGMVPPPVDLAAPGRAQPSSNRTRDFSFYPVMYDLRTLGEVTPVKYVGNCDASYAFATMSSLESAILKGTGKMMDLSENHLKNNHGYEWPPCGGGNVYMSLAYLARWAGPVLEEDDPYRDWDDRPSPSVEPVCYVRRMLFFTTPEEIKWGLMYHGALYTYMYYDPSGDSFNTLTNTYYYSGEPVSDNHVVTIVGWNDGKVVPGAPGPGAWICENSWGDRWGENGYFHISYHDTQGARFGISFCDTVPTDTYDINYQHDPLGMTAVWETPWAANVFTAESDGFLTAAAFYTQGLDTRYQVLVDNDYGGEGFQNAGLVVSGQHTASGYHTVPFPTPVRLTRGKRFAIVLHLETADVESPMALEFPWDGFANAQAGPGESYVSYDGVEYTDVHSDLWPGTNVCLKGFAVSILPPERPVAVSPPTGSTRVDVAPTFQASAFVDPDPSATHAASHWQIRAQSNPDYALPIWDSGESAVALTSAVVPPGRLNYGTTYLWRVRYSNNGGVWSEWSPEASFSTVSSGVANTPPLRPRSVSPFDGQQGLPATPVLEASAFEDADTGDHHTASQFRVRPENGSWASSLYDSGTLADAIISHRVPTGYLSSDALHYWQVRYRDSRNAWSEWSVDSSFRTVAAADFAPPEGVRAVGGAQSVWLTWRTHPSSDIVAYRLYRSAAEDGPYEPVDGGRIEGASEYFDDHLEAGVTYWYRLTAISSDGRESAPTSSVSALVGATRVFMSDMRGEPGQTISQMIAIGNPNNIANEGLQMDVLYDDDLLESAGFRRTGLTSEFQLSSRLVGNTEGHLVIVGEGEGLEIHGEGHILELLFRVRDDAEFWKQSSVLFDHVVLAASGTPPHAVDIDYSSSATVTVAAAFVLGDMDQSGRVDVIDLMTLSQIILGQIQPNDLQRRAGDMNGDGLLDSADLVLMRRLVLGVTEGGQIAADDRIRHDQSSPSAHRLVWGRQTNDNEYIRVSLEVDTLDGVAGLDLVINFNPRHLRFITADRGQALATFESWKAYEETGQLRVVVAASMPSEGGTGQVARLNFSALNPSEWTTTPLSVARMKICNEKGQNLARMRTVTTSNTIIRRPGTEPAASDLWALYP